MKRNYLVIAVMAVAALIISSCAKDKEQAKGKEQVALVAVLNTLDVTDITAGTARFNGKIIEAGSPKYTERGFVYSTSSKPTLETTKITVVVTESEEYAANVAGLTPGQTYYVRAYAINTAGTAYSSNEVRFVATALMPTLSTEAVTNISIAAGVATVTFNGTILTLGDPAYTERGFVYGTVHNPTVVDDTKKAVSGTTTGAFSTNVTDFMVETIYYVRAYATNSKGTVYGAEISLNFNAVMPTLTTEAATDINATTATLNATIINVGDPAYTERGFVYATFDNPTIEDATKKIVSGTDIGKYDCNLTGLTMGTTYHVRAYAINRTGTVYGTQLSFNTIDNTNVVLSSIGLMVTSKDISGNFNKVNMYCENLLLDGFDDWRLPIGTEYTSMKTSYYDLGLTTSYWCKDVLVEGDIMPGTVMWIPYSTAKHSATGYGNSRCVRTLP